jgi:hypothetical protein
MSTKARKRSHVPLVDESGFTQVVINLKLKSLKEEIYFKKISMKPNRKSRNKNLDEKS